MTLAEDSSAFLNNHRIYLRLWGYWMAEAPTSRWRYILLQIQRSFNTLVIAAYLFGLFYNVYYVPDKTMALVGTLCMVVETTCLTIRMFIYWINQSKFRQLVKFSDCEEFKPKNEEHIKIWNKRANNARKLSKYYFLLSVATYLVTFIQNPPKVEKGMPYPIKFPYFENITVSPIYECYYGFEVYLAAVFFGLTSCLDILMTSFIFQAMAQIECLLYTVEHITDDFPKTVQISEDDDRTECNDGVEVIEDIALQMNYDYSLKEVIEKHILIIKFVRDLNDVFGLALFTQYICYAVVIGTGEYFLLFINDLGVLLPVAIYLLYILVEVYILCWSGEQIKSKSSLLSEKIFHCTWHKCSPSFKNDMKIFMSVSQNPIEICYGTIFALHLNIFTKILNGAYSFLALMRNLASLRNTELQEFWRT